MLENIILAYRSQFYDWGLEETANFYKRNKKILFGFIVFALLIIVTAVYSIINKTSVLMLFFILIELIIGIACDRFMVKRHKQYILRKKEHIYDVKLFMETVIPDKNLFTKKQIEELIERLSIRIDTGAPFNKFKSFLSNFGKFIVIPIITYFAGLYTTSIRDLEITVVLVWTISLIFIIGFGYITCGMIFQAIQKITCRNYDAAIALKEDLLDIKLLFF